ncbi:MAG: DUF58 domain-containing protein, partial [Dehalococcoidales bacterium]|nr:DUF58 domain-containing protein [Dehalococcoidales bacterium]
MALAGGFTLLFRLFVFMVVVLVSARVWSHLSSSRLGARVGEIAPYHRVGSSFEVEFTLSSSFRLPIPRLEVTVASDIPDYQETTAFSLPSGGSRSWRGRIRLTKRGRYHIGPLLVKVSDPFGFFPVVRRLGEARYFTVLPAALELPYFDIIPRREMGENIRRWLASGSGPGASRVREYASGDSLRRIHWQTTAHVGRLVVKEFDPDRTYFAFNELWLVPDMCRTYRLGENGETTEDYAITIAASLARKYIDEGKRVGLLAAGERPYICLAEAGQRHLERILHDLALLRAHGTTPIGEWLELQAERFGSGSVVAVIMPSDNQSVVLPLRQAQGRGAIIVIVLLDALSFGGKEAATATARRLVA